MIVRELRERERAAQQRARYHHAKFEGAISSLRRLASQAEGEGVKAAGRRLAGCDLSEIQPAVQAFADALRQASYASTTAERSARLLALSRAAIAELRDMAHHVERVAVAHHDLLTANRMGSEMHKEVPR